MIVTILFIATLYTQTVNAESDIIAPGAKVEQLAGGFEFTEGPAADAAGNVYLTGKGVLVFDSTGNLIEHIAISEPWTANVCFGGKDGHTLFITASRGLYAIRMRTQGVGSQ